jgi:hypothetical protein
MRQLFLALTLFVATASMAQEKKASKTDSTAVRKTVVAFYQWYNTNWKKVDAFQLYKSKKGNDGPPYVIDWRQVEKYFTFLRTKAPMLGKAFIEYERAFFKHAEQSFKDNPEEEMPVGFDYDRFTNSQEEPSLFWKELTKKSNRWVVTIDDQDKNKAYVRVYPAVKQSTEDQVLCGTMVKEKGVWKIGRLHCEEIIDVDLPEAPDVPEND